MTRACISGLLGFAATIFVAGQVRALETLLVAKGYVDPAALEAIIETYETKVGPRNGAKVVAKAWTDLAYRDWLLQDATAAIAALGFGGRQGEHMVAVENSDAQHNLVVCTLCSCYPWPVLGLPPVWYKSPAYRWNWDSPVLLSPHDPHTLYYGGNYLFRSLNRGDSWQVLSPDLTRGAPGPSADRGHTITTIAESPLRLARIRLVDRLLVFCHLSTPAERLGIRDTINQMRGGLSTHLRYQARLPEFPVRSARRAPLDDHDGRVVAGVG